MVSKLDMFIPMALGYSFGYFLTDIPKIGAIIGAVICLFAMIGRFRNIYIK